MSCGSSYDLGSLEALSEIDYSKVMGAIKLGKMHHERSRKIMNSLLRKESQCLMRDVATVVINFLPGIDMLKALA